jgi:hypothetical protein
LSQLNGIFPLGHNSNPEVFLEHQRQKLFLKLISFIRRIINQRQENLRVHRRGKGLRNAEWRRFRADKRRHKEGKISMPEAVPMTKKKFRICHGTDGNVKLETSQSVFGPKSSFQWSENVDEFRRK